MQHVIRFNGRISWEGRASGLPETIYAFLIYDGDDRDGINRLIETQVSNFLKAQAMMVQKDQGQIIDLRKIPQDRMVVPMRWIAFMDVNVMPLTGELSQADEDGVERFKDGSEPEKQ
jgi:hypothetical protein